MLIIWIINYCSNILYLLIASELWSQQEDESLGCGNDLLWALVPALLFLSWAPVTYFYLLMNSGPSRRMKVWAAAMAFYELLFQLWYSFHELQQHICTVLIAGELGSKEADESLGCGNGLLWAIVPALVFLSWAPVTYFYLLIAGDLGSQEADESLGCGNWLLWALVSALVFLSWAPTTYFYLLIAGELGSQEADESLGCGNGLTVQDNAQLIPCTWTFVRKCNLSIYIITKSLRMLDTKKSSLAHYKFFEDSSTDDAQH
jgi:hypothetical protein